MSILIRRSNLMVPVTNAKFVKGAWRHGADAITLDLEDGVVPALKVRARDLVKDAVAAAGKCAAEVFVRVNKEFWRRILMPRCGRAFQASCCQKSNPLKTLSRRPRC